MAAVIAVVVSAPGLSGSHSSAARAPHATVRRLPPYWIVRPGDTFTQIAEKTGLTVAQLEAFNPQADPSGLVPGIRIIRLEQLNPQLKPTTLQPGDRLSLRP